MPKLTKAPLRAAVAARSTAARKASASPIVWSDGITSISGSGSVSLSASAATHAAGAVLRPIGSSSSARGTTRNLAQLLGDDEAMFFVGDEERRGKPPVIRNPPHGLLQQAVPAEQRQQLLRIERAGHRPQPGARTARTERPGKSFLLLEIPPDCSAG